MRQALDTRIATALLLLFAIAGCRSESDPFLAALRGDDNLPMAQLWRNFSDERLLSMADQVCRRWEADDPPLDVRQAEVVQWVIIDGWSSVIPPFEGASRERQGNNLYWTALREHCEPEAYELARQFADEFGKQVQDQAERVLNDTEADQTSGSTGDSEPSGSDESADAHDWAFEDAYERAFITAIRETNRMRDESFDVGTSSGLPAMADFLEGELPQLRELVKPFSERTPPARWATANEHLIYGLTQLEQGWQESVDGIRANDMVRTQLATMTVQRAIDALSFATDAAPERGGSGEVRADPDSGRDVERAARAVADEDSSSDEERAARAMCSVMNEQTSGHYTYQEFETSLRGWLTLGRDELQLYKALVAECGDRLADIAPTYEPGSLD